MTKIDWHPFNPKDKSTFPPKDGEYIVTLKTLCGEKFTTCRSWYDRLHRFPKDIMGYQVTAWAEMPKPYKGA